MRSLNAPPSGCSAPDTFDSLPEPERQEVMREILRRTALAKHGPLEDAELLALADEVFLELDRGERPR
ncbi:MAG: hypothetical protein HYW08_18235 [candidate division NC10 bacterium]|nr:hypothetical protein [candidate division NC10 bacterium]